MYETFAFSLWHHLWGRAELSVFLYKFYEIYLALFNSLLKKNVPLFLDYCFILV